MLGANGAFPECTSSRTAKYHGIEIFQIPMRDDDFHFNWRNNIVPVLGRCRVNGESCQRTYTYWKNLHMRATF